LTTVTVYYKPIDILTDLCSDIRNMLPVSRANRRHCKSIADCNLLWIYLFIYLLHFSFKPKW